MLKYLKKNYCLLLPFLTFLFSPHVVASLLKLYLQELPNPLIPIKYIPLPIKDSPDYICQVFLSLPETTQKLLKDLIPVVLSVIKNSSRTYQSIKTISLDLAPCFIGRYASSKEKLTVAVRFTKNLIDFWPEIVRSVDSDFSSSSSDSDGENVTKTTTIATKISSRSSSGRHSKILPIGSARSSFETLPPGFHKPLPTSFTSQNSSTTSLSSAQSLNAGGLASYSYVTDSTGRSASKSDDFLPTSSSNFNSNSANNKVQTPVTSSSSSASSSATTSPPPPPPLRKSVSMAFKSDSGSDRSSVMLNERKSMSNLNEKPAALKSISVSTKRGKMVAELAKLYEV